MMRKHETTHRDYRPEPEDLSGIALPDSLTELTEFLAENIHDVWARNRMEEGWTYGPQRDDFRKHHPNMLPYHLLPESEKKYARQTAINTIKLLKKLGWDLVKKKG